MATFNALGTRGAIFLLHQFRGLQVSFGLQGSREPRLSISVIGTHILKFQSTRLSRASTKRIVSGTRQTTISIHKALASLDVVPTVITLPQTGISIHKALASLDLMQ